MKLAILSDIHGNSEALTAVLSEVKKLDIKKLLILGDCVGYYYHPDIVFEKLSEWDCYWIYGNHEILMQSFLDGNETYKNKLRRKYGSGFDICVERLPNDVLRFISELPETKMVSLENINIQMCHGSPWNYDTYLYPDANINDIERCDQPGVDFVLMGHTHYPFSFKGKNSFIANVGSVGQSRVMGGISNWAIIDLSNKVYIPKHTPYDTRKLKEESKKNDPDLPYLWQILDRNGVNNGK